MKNMASIKDEVLEYSREIGIDLLGVTSPEPFKRYLTELSKRETYYTHRYAYRINTWKKFANPKQMMPDAKSVIVIGFYYLTHEMPDAGIRGKIGRIVTYGHLAILERVRLIAKFLEKKGFKAIMGSHRKEAAVRAGLGHIGKNSLVINEKYGSWVAYQSIITDAEMEYDEPSTGEICGQCSDCVSSCPTSAIYDPYRVNPQRCITCLLTSDDLPQESWGKLQHYILGCDICQENCPKSKGLRPKDNIKGLLPDWIGNNPLLEDLLNLDERSFQKKIISHITGKITGSPLLGFIMNNADWIGNNPLIGDLLSMDEKYFKKGIISHITRKITGSPLLGFIIRYSWQKKILKILKHLWGSSGGKETLPETLVLASSKLHAYQRNAIIAASSIGDPKLRRNIERFLDNPRLQKYANWALERIRT